jgi:hypothetical protein
MKTICLLAILIIAASCDLTKKDTEKDSLPKPGSSSTSLIHCYSFANENDTITLKLIHVGKSITGGLVYKLKEKDKNEGTIQGFMRDNLLVADYTFISEGMQSVRQVVFKQEENDLIEGYGDVIVTDGKAQFKSIDSLNFNESMKLKERPCN